MVAVVVIIRTFMVIYGVCQMISQTNKKSFLQTRSHTQAHARSVKQLVNIFNAAFVRVMMSCWERKRQVLNVTMFAILLPFTHYAVKWESVFSCFTGSPLRGIKTMQHQYLAAKI